MSEVRAISGSKRSVGVARLAEIAAWLAPLLIIFGFAFIAAAPVAVAIVGVLRGKSGTALRVLAGVWAIAYFVPFALYLAQDTYPSMAKMYPIWAHLGMALPGMAIAILLLRQRR